MLGQPIEKFVYNEDGTINGVVLQNHPGTIRTKRIIAQPNYLLKENPSKVRMQGRIIRCIVIFTGTVANTNNAASCQIILPSKEICRQHDIYIAVLSNTLYVTPPKSNYAIAVISTVQEKQDGSEASLQSEIQSA
uniref:Putative secretory pathway GDP dissociation inhibitor 1 n=1 Tax=Lygus hesperus TaxID=30085 RepID=A0A0A9YWE2_LYGHE